jgi:WXG100 family type VII secretion target
MLRASPDELLRVSEMLSRGTENVSESLKALDAQVSNTLGGWRGASGAAYEDIWRQWHSGADEVHLGLSLLAELLGQAAHDYASQEQASAAAVRSVPR